MMRVRLNKPFDQQLERAKVNLEHIFLYQKLHTSKLPIRVPKPFKLPTDGTKQNLEFPSTDRKPKETYKTNETIDTAYMIKHWSIDVLNTKSHVTELTRHLIQPLTRFLNIKKKKLKILSLFQELCSYERRKNNANIWYDCKISGEGKCKRI